jgi:hypothetical protein
MIFFSGDQFGEGDVKNVENSVKEKYKITL